MVLHFFAVALPFVDRFLKPMRTTSFLFGPRGTGKTLWLRHAFPNAVRIDLLSTGQFRHYAGFPERLRETVCVAMDRLGPDLVVTIDEIQRLPELLDVVHGLAVDFPPLSLFLTGSSARKLRRGGVNLLAGRAILRRMHPFMAAELGDAFSLPKALRLGMLPVVWGANFPEKTLATYVGTYLEEEVRSEGLVRNVGAFARFLEAASFSHGSIRNYATVARECSVDAKTVASYYGILEDLLLAFTIPVFARKASRAMAVGAKFYLCDSGIYRSLRPRMAGDDPRELGGAALEGLVAQHLRAWCDYSEGDHTLSHWRTRNGREVDFVVHGDSGICAIEVKSCREVHPQHLHGLHAFAADYPEARLFLLHGGSFPRKIGAVTCLPCEEFLKNLRPNSFYSAA
jgi:predicted AAA+ superfamily ATPase